MSINLLCKYNLGSFFKAETVTQGWKYKLSYRLSRKKKDVFSESDAIHTLMPKTGPGISANAI